MLIREAQVEDAGAIAHLLDQLDYPRTESFINRRILQLLNHPDALLLVAELNQRVVGVLSLHFIPQLALAGDYCRISHFCIADDVRSQGIGARLEAMAEVKARERGCDRIEVHCHARRKAAHRFYQRQGYQASPKYFEKPL